MAFLVIVHISLLYLKPLSEFQRIAGRDKKALSEQCKEIEENNRKGKARDLFKKIGVTKGTFSYKDERNKGEQEKRLRRDGKNTQKNCTKKGLSDAYNHNGVVTHLEPDILECEVKWALGSITMSKLVEVMVFQLSYFKS